MTTRLGLGTVQFGLDYGKLDPYPKTSVKEIGLILAHAAQNGIEYLDTAFEYGSSQQALGQCLPEGRVFRVVTKIPAFRKEAITRSDLEKAIGAAESAFSQLKQTRLYGLLAHHGPDLLSRGGGGLFRTMLNLKKTGRVQKIGVSVYAEDPIGRILETYPIDLIQLPFSVLDQRLLSSGLLQKMKKKGIEIHARSVFLQGLLLKQPAKLPPYFHKIRGRLAKYHRFLRERKLSALEAALGYVSSVPEVDVVLCGVNSLSQLKEILAAYGKSCFDFREEFRRFALDEAAYLNPALWPDSQAAAVKAKT